METGDAAVVKQASPAVVNIAEWKVHTPTRPGQSPRRVKVYASGFVIDPSGVIVTNRHVVDGALDMRVIFSNGDRVPARLLVAAAMIDVAVLKVDVDHPLPALKWADSDFLQIGDPVLTIGNPLGLGMSVSAGIVSALNRNLHDTPFDSYIQTDAAINYGNSGGPLIDSNGSVVGLDTALYKSPGEWRLYWHRLCDPIQHRLVCRAVPTQPQSSEARMDRCHRAGHKRQIVGSAGGTEGRWRRRLGGRSFGASGSSRPAASRCAGDD